MKIALIGGSGFIGTRLGELLDNQGIPFTILDKVRSDAFPDACRIVDIRDFHALTSGLEGSDTIINLAAEHRDDVQPASLYVDVNVTGSENVCRAAEENGIRRIIFTSSVAVYGEAPPEADEATTCRPFNDYGKTKLEAESVYTRWLDRHKSNTLAIIRPTVVFGEGNRGNVYNLFRQIASGRFLFIGNGRNRKAMAYVGNVAAFILHVLQNRNEGTWNYVDTPIPETRELVSRVRTILGKSSGTGFRIPKPAGILGGLFFDLVARIIGRSLPISLVRIRKFMQESSFSAEKALSTGFKPVFDLTESLERVIRHEFQGEGEI